MEARVMYDDDTTLYLQTHWYMQERNSALSLFSDEGYVCVGHMKPFDRPTNLMTLEMMNKEPSGGNN